MDKKLYIIGGSPCSGKSTVAERLSQDYNLYYFKVDDYLDELLLAAVKNGMPICSKLKFMTADEIWMRSPSEQCEEEFVIYKEIAEFVFEKINAINEDIVIAEGAAFTPEIMKRATQENYICIVPTPEFQISHYKMRKWVSYVLKDCTDEKLAFDNWMQRDIMFARQINEMCKANGIPCIINDGVKSVDEVYEIVKKVMNIS